MSAPNTTTETEEVKRVLDKWRVTSTTSEEETCLPIRFTTLEMSMLNALFGRYSKNDGPGGPPNPFEGKWFKTSEVSMSKTFFDGFPNKSVNSEMNDALAGLPNPFEGKWRSYWTLEDTGVGSDKNASIVLPHDDAFETKLAWVVSKLKQFKGKIVLHTGAGLSTSASIPDFRGKDGVWTRRDKGMKPPKSIKLELAVPTPAHIAINKLVETGYCEHVVSQNVDGLHLRSGLPREKLSELHGNCFLEVCDDCNKEYLRTYNASQMHGPYFAESIDRKSESGISHITGRKCDNCGGMLRDSVVHFGESLRDLTKAYEHCDYDRFHLVLGTSLHVSPANKMPHIRDGNCCIVSISPTARDRECVLKGGVIVNSTCDHFMKALFDYMFSGECDDLNRIHLAQKRYIESEGGHAGPNDTKQEIGQRPDLFRVMGLPPSSIMPPSKIQFILNDTGYLMVQVLEPEGYAASTFFDLIETYTVNKNLITNPKIPHQTRNILGSMGEHDTDDSLFPKQDENTLALDIYMKLVNGAEVTKKIHLGELRDKNSAFFFETSIPFVPMSQGFLSRIQGGAIQLRTVKRGVKITDTNGQVTFKSRNE